MSTLQQQLANAPHRTRLEEVQHWLEYAHKRAKERRATVYVFTPDKGCFSLTFEAPGPRETQHSHVVTWDRATGRIAVAENEGVLA